MHSVIMITIVFNINKWNYPACRKNSIAFYVMWSFITEAELKFGLVVVVIGVYQNVASHQIESSAFQPTLELMAPLLKTNSRCMEMVLIQCCRANKLLSWPSIYHVIHLSGLQYIFSSQHLIGGLKLCMASQPLIICFPDKEGCGGQTTATRKIKAVVFFCLAGDLLRNSGFKTQL